MAIRAPFPASLRGPKLLLLVIFLLAVLAGCEKEGGDSTPAATPGAEEAAEPTEASTQQVMAAQVAVLEDPDAEPEARLRAIQELRELGAKQAAPALRPYLDHELSPLRVAAAAALVALDDHPSHAQILKVAEDLSRDRDPQYVPMLFVVADLGSPEAQEYLRTVAEAHPAPAVRQVASDALEEVKR